MNGQLEAGEQWVRVPFEVDKRFDGLRVDRYLAQRLTAYSRGQVQKILQASRVMLQDRVIKPSARVRMGDKLLVAYPRRPEVPLDPEAALPILYEDAHLLIIHKPPRLLSHPTDKVVQHTVTGILRHSRPDLKTLHLLHRLDRETSGVLALAKSPDAARAWTEAMESRQMQKEYLAVTWGTVKPVRGVLDAPIGRQGGEIKVRQWVNVPGAVRAQTRYEVAAGGVLEGAPVSVIRAFPETGRLHQIRVHLAAFGHPLLGDLLYQGTGALYKKLIAGTLSDEERRKTGFERLALHAAALSFPHPVTGIPLKVCAPLPEDLQTLLESVGCGKNG